MLTKKAIYQPRGGEAAWSGPSDYSNAHLYAFAVPVSARAVHEMLARYITWPSQSLNHLVDVRGTTLKTALFTFIHSTRTLPADKKTNRAAITFQERLFAIVVLGYRMPTDDHPDPSLILFAPYAYASNTPGWNAGREMYGYPRQQGDVRIPDDLPPGGEIPPCLSVHAPIIEKFGQGNMAKYGEILSIKQIASNTRKPSEPIKSRKEASRVIAGNIKATELKPSDRKPTQIQPQPVMGVTAQDFAMKHLVSGTIGGVKPFDPPVDSLPELNLEDELMGGRVPMLFLKQFRDVVFPDRACYQAIVEAPFKIHGDPTGHATGGYKLTLANVDSAPIARELNIKSDKSSVSGRGSVETTVDMAFSVKLDRMTVGGTGDERPRVISNPGWNHASVVTGVHDLHKRRY